MKKILTLLSLIILVSNVYAQPFIGGEITWSCNSSGNYDFEFRYYRDCGGISFPQQLNLTTSVPGLNTIQMNLDTVIEITPVCHNSGPAIQCSSQNIMNTGTVEQWIYSSKTSFPNGVVLSGFPPTAGWAFSFSSCCRLPSTNLSNSGSLGYTYRAIMYAYNNQGANICFDNAPEFKEIPQSILCANEQAWINYSASDLDNDSLSYEFAYPHNWSINSPITNYNYGYSFSSPFPGPLTNSNNIAAYLNPTTGLMNFTSFETGAFDCVIKVSSYREGQLISEIFRDFHSIIDTCGINTSPNVSFQNGFHEYMDTVMVGELVNFGVSATDFEFLSNGNPQTITMEAFSDHFGVNDTSTTIGCPFPPCAVLSPPSITVGQFGVQKTVQWQTDCSHLNGNSTYDFIFKQRDDFCPVPSTSYAIARIVVEDYPELLPPTRLCADADMSGAVNLSWPLISDTLSQFHSYILYHFDTLSNSFVVLDTIFDINQTNYFHQNASGLLNSQSYQIRVLSGCKGDKLSTASPTSSSLFLTANADFIGFSFVELNWNTISNSSTPLYSIFADYLTGWSLIGSTSDTTYSDSSAMILPAVRYKIIALDTFGFDASGLPFLCTSESNEVLIVGNEEYGIEGLSLGQNTPNPCSEIAIIEYELPHSGDIKFCVNNLLGQLVYQFLGHEKKGIHQIELSAEQIPSGIYFYSIEFENRRISKKMIIAH